MKQSKIQIDDFYGITSHETAKNLLNALNSVNTHKEKINLIEDFLLRVCHICEDYFKEKAKEAVIDELCNKFRGFLAE